MAKTKILTDAGLATLVSEIKTQLDTKLTSADASSTYMTKSNPTGEGTLTMIGDGVFNGSVEVESLQIGGVTLNYDNSNKFLEFVFTSTTDEGTEESTVTFTINGISYSVDNGTTWEEFANEQGNYTQYDNAIYLDETRESYICDSNYSVVSKDDVIQPGSYLWYNVGSSGGADD